MKSIILGTVALLFSLHSQAQNQNTSTVTKTTTTTIKDNEGEHKIVKKEETKELQNIELNAVPSNTLNTEVKDTPVQVTSTTKVTVDGVQKIVDVDRSAYYMYNDTRYQIVADKYGYTVTNPNSSRLALLRKTSNNNYIYKNRHKFSIGHFDANGNLILETYDERTDQVTTEIFNLQK